MIQQAKRQIYLLVIKNCQHPDGGFVFERRRVSRGINESSKSAENRAEIIKATRKDEFIKSAARCAASEKKSESK